jgi:D-galactarolactone isomerase
VAARIAPLGWHVCVQGHGDWLVGMADRLSSLPVDFVVDHMGRIPVESGVDNPAFVALLRLLETGRCWVKLSAPYHVSHTGKPGYADVGERGRTLVAVAPERMLWASNWPHPSVKNGAAIPDDADLLNLLLDWVPNSAALRRILAANPAKLYGFED